MKKLDQFTLKAFIGPFVAILLIVVFILMMQFLWLYIDELVGKGLSFGVIMEFMMWGACTILPMAMPLAVLLSSMMVIGQMGENKELMAIKAAGISLGRLIAPLIVTAAIISVGAFFVGNDLVPKAYNEIFTLRDDITRTKGEIKIPPGTFYDGIEGYVLRVEGRNDETGMMYQVQVYDHTMHRGNTAIIIADSALLKISKAKDYLTFSLFNGSNYQETNEMTYRDTSLALSRIDFAREELIIPLKNYSFESLCTILCCCLQYFKFMCLLTKILCQHFLCRLRSNYALTLWDKIVASIATLYIYYIILVSQADNIFFQYNFHYAILL